MTHLTQELLYKVKMGLDYQPIALQISNLTRVQLATALQSDVHKICFWVNLYNAYIQIILQEKSGLSQAQLFTQKWIDLAGVKLSFDAIEHGLLRRSQFKYGLGYLTNPFPNAFEKSFRLQKRDYRIHFALNCGAVSCPPIAFYEVDKLDAQLELATANFLVQNSKFDLLQNQVSVSRLMFWFLGDFGGKSGIVSILKTYQIIPKDAQPKIKFDLYDWTLRLHHYV